MNSIADNRSRFASRVRGALVIFCVLTVISHDRQAFGQRSKVAQKPLLEAFETLALQQEAEDKDTGRYDWAVGHA